MKRFGNLWMGFLGAMSFAAMAQADDTAANNEDTSKRSSCSRGKSSTMESDMRESRENEGQSVSSGSSGSGWSQASRADWDGHSYLKFGSGASISNRSHISAPISAWDFAPEGYSSKLGTRPIVDAGFGYEFCPFLSTDIMLAYRPNFKYKKFQNSINLFNIPGFLGPKTRRFNLDLLSLMGTIYLSGRGWKYSCYQFGNNNWGEIYPVIGGGVGITQCKIFNFRSTGLPPITGTFPSFGSENEYTIRYRFTYQLMGGLEFRFKNNWALGAGYRWFDVRKFRGPQYLREPDGDSFDIGTNGRMKIDFSANEAYVELKIFL